MNAELCKGWFVVQNGAQIDIHVKDKAQSRELTMAQNVRDEDYAQYICDKVNAPSFEQVMELAATIVEQTQLNLWRCDSREAEVTRWLAIEIRNRATKAWEETATHCLEFNK